MAEPMKIRATIAGDVADVKVLMNHPMETGQRRDSRFRGRLDSARCRLRAACPCEGEYDARGSGGIQSQATA